MTCKFVQRRVNEFGLRVATNFFLFIPALSFVFFSFYFYPIPIPMPSLLEPVQKRRASQRSYSGLRRDAVRCFHNGVGPVNCNPEKRVRKMFTSLSILWAYSSNSSNIGYVAQTAKNRPNSICGAKIIVYKTVICRGRRKWTTRYIPRLKRGSTLEQVLGRQLPPNLGLAPPQIFWLQAYSVNLRRSPLI